MMELFEQRYDPEVKIDDAIVLAMESIYMVSDEKTGIKHIKLLVIDNDTRTLRRLSEKDLLEYAKRVKPQADKPEKK